MILGQHASRPQFVVHFLNRQLLDRSQLKEAQLSSMDATVDVFCFVEIAKDGLFLGRKANVAGYIVQP